MRAVVVFAWLALGGCRYGFDRVGDDNVAGDGGRDDGVTDGGDHPNRVFITSTAYPASFGGVAAADDHCQQHADTASLDGAFIALLGEDARPEPRLAGARGWVDLAGTPIVDEPATWLDGYMFHPLHLDENGADIGYALAWVGSIYSCTGWSSTTTGEQGSVVVTGDTWGAYSVQGCGQQARLVCAETGHVAPQVPATVAGRIAFVTTSNWTSGGGLSSADTFCGVQAAANNLPGTYKALLATSTDGPFARFSLTGAPWTRVDGIPITATAAELASSATTWLSSSPHVRADGTRYPYVNTWVGSAAQNCNDWNSASAGQMGTVGSPVSAFRSLWLSAYMATCDGPRALTCLQE